MGHLGSLRPHTLVAYGLMHQELKAPYTSIAYAPGNDSADVERERQGVRVEVEAMAETLTAKGGLIGARSVLLYLGEPVGG